MENRLIKRQFSKSKAMRDCRRDLLNVANIKIKEPTLALPASRLFARDSFLSCWSFENEDGNPPKFHKNHHSQ